MGRRELNDCTVGFAATTFHRHHDKKETIISAYLPLTTCNNIFLNSFSATGTISGMEYNATAFVGCDNGLVSLQNKYFVYITRDSK